MYIKYRFDYFNLENIFRLIHKNLKDSKIGRGVNFVAIDGKTFDVKLIDTFDTYSEGR